MLTRRRFVTASIALFSAASAPASMARSRAEQTPLSAPVEIVAATAEHLLPSRAGVPGARRCNAAGYFEKMLASPYVKRAVRHALVEGALQVDKRALETYSKRFVTLDSAQKEALLRGIGSEVWGDMWLWQLMGFVFEAVLGDPVYGGNPDGAAWAWLGHEPGLPRPEKAFI